VDTKPARGCKHLPVNRTPTSSKQPECMRKAYIYVHSTLQGTIPALRINAFGCRYRPIPFSIYLVFHPRGPAPGTPRTCIRERENRRDILVIDMAIHIAPGQSLGDDHTSARVPWGLQTDRLANLGFGTIGFMRTTVIVFQSFIGTGCFHLPVEWPSSTYPALSR
jgi:hypothetical protein